MTRDQLFLLNPGFTSGDAGPCYCPSCATLEGVLGYYPALRTALDVRHVDFPRPRAAVIAALGEANQGLPVLVIAPGAAADQALSGLDVQEAQGRRFLQGVGDIGRYLARRYGTGEPH